MEKITLTLEIDGVKYGETYNGLSDYDWQMLDLAGVQLGEVIRETIWQHRRKEKHG